MRLLSNRFPWQRVTEKMAATVRGDIFQTSTGVGHHWRPGYYFPSSNFKTELRNPLPPKLVQHPEICFTEHYKTTTGTAHDLKQQGCTYGNLDPLYKKAPGHWKVHYNKDLHEKLQPGGWRRPLTMGYQASETHDEFRGQPGIVEPRLTHNIQGYLLAGNLTDGPSQQIFPTTKNDKLRGRVFYPNNKAIMDLNDPYLTTTNQFHRRFTHKELDSYPRKDIATYWECEEYLKAWGFGMKHNPLPKDTVPREPLPMRDTMVFKSPTKIRRIPPAAIPVPHSGLNSEYDDRFQAPSNVRCKEANFCPVNTPYLLPAPGNKVTFITPHMYKTEYMNIGSERPLTV